MTVLKFFWNIFYNSNVTSFEQAEPSVSQIWKVNVPLDRAIFNVSEPSLPVVVSVEPLTLIETSSPFAPDQVKSTYLTPRTFLNVADKTMSDF